jgi:hypothetical protein
MSAESSNVTTITITDPSQFDETLANHLEDKFLFVLISGEKVEETGKSW